MEVARRFFLRQMAFVGALSLSGWSLFAKPPHVTAIPEPDPYLDLDWEDEMYDESDEMYGMEGWL